MNRQKKASDQIIDDEVLADSCLITLWEGGGVTGVTTGFNLLSSGQVISWQRFRAREDTVMWKAEGYASEIASLRKDLVKTGALVIDHTETGNMTAGITYETAEKKYAWTWEHTGSAADIPEPLRIWYQRAIAFCRSLHK